MKIINFKREKLTTSPTTAIRTTEDDMDEVEAEVLTEAERREAERKLRGCTWAKTLSIPFIYLSSNTSAPIEFLTSKVKL